MMPESTVSPTLAWSWGTAYDLFISLHVLHKPNKFGLRGAWAKGVRSRFPADVRDFFEELHESWMVPLHLAHSLPAPRDSETLIHVLTGMTPQERFSSLMHSPDMPAQVSEILENVAVRGKWDLSDQEALWAAASQEKQYAPKADDINRLLGWWARRDEVGEQYLDAIKTYYDVFFAEEDNRIRPALEEGIINAHELAKNLTIPELLEELSQGVRFEVIPDKPELTLIPSFWVSPLIIMSSLSETANLFVYGARPADASLVPGAVVPDALFRTLKALADPTRLRILRYLSREPLTPTDLAKRLRLRAPTVIHHLSTLRLAGLVYLSFPAKGDKRYAARINRLGQAFDQLQDFIGQDIGIE